MNLIKSEEPCPIWILTKSTKITICNNIDVSKFASGFILQMDFSFLNVERFRGFTSTFVTICFATIYHFRLKPTSKHPPLNTLKSFMNTLRNKDKKVALVWVDEDGAMETSSELMSTRHNMNIIFQKLQHLI